MLALPTPSQGLTRRACPPATCERHRLVCSLFLLLHQGLVPGSTGCAECVKPLLTRRGSGMWVPDTDRWPQLSRLGAHSRTYASLSLRGTRVNVSHPPNPF